ncbi:hypothetical protein GBA52_008754 [Prunus armeniaca]|nr:hypothetical protein GBA52_008754 [Prunus armeniaca]
MKLRLLHPSLLTFVNLLGLSTLCIQTKVHLSLVLPTKRLTLECVSTHFAYPTHSLSLSLWLSLSSVVKTALTRTLPNFESNTPKLKHQHHHHHHFPKFTPPLFPLPSSAGLSATP